MLESEIKKLTQAIQANTEAVLKLAEAGQSIPSGEAKAYLAFDTATAALVTAPASALPANDDAEEEVKSEVVEDAPAFTLKDAKDAGTAAVKRNNGDRKLVRNEVKKLGYERLEEMADKPEDLAKFVKAVEAL